MGLERIAPPAAEPVTLAEAKAHLRVDGSGEDALIASLAVAAREAAERYTGRALIAQDWRLWRDAWPAGGIVPLPLPPLLAVTSVSVFGTDGAEQAVPSAHYVVDAASAPGRIVFVPGAVPPAALRAANGFAVAFTAGYGADAADVPQAIRTAILMILAHLFARRGDAAGELPPGALALLAPYRAVRL